MKALATRLLFRVAGSKLGGAITGWAFGHVSSWLPVNKLVETDTVLAFHHPKPGYVVHVLIVPKRAVKSLLELDDPAVVADAVGVAQRLIRELHLDEKGYRLLVNGGEYQEIGQLHFHLISGDQVV